MESPHVAFVSPGHGRIVQTVTAEGDDKRGELVALCRDDHEIAERTLASDAIVEGAAYLWRSCQIAEALKFLTAFDEWSGGWSQAPPQIGIDPSVQTHPPPH